MQYKHGLNTNYEDYSSGRVLYHFSGTTNFPVRLAQEIFGRCLEYSIKKEQICLYDCCCGAAYLLTVLGFMNQGIIDEIIGSDIEPKAIFTAKNNLSLLTYNGINQRLIELEKLVADFNKTSHKEAIASALKLKSLILNNNVKTSVFKANALEPINIHRTPDIIITDVPYSNITTWKTAETGLNELLDSLYAISDTNTVIAICMDKKQKASYPKFIRLEKQIVGKRKFEIFKKQPEGEK